MGFMSWFVRSLLFYAPFALGIALLVMGHSPLRAIGAVLLGMAVFWTAGWFEYRRKLHDEASVSATKSRARARTDWPTETEVLRAGFAAGVRPGDSRRRSHMLVLAPDTGTQWWYVREPGRSGRGAVDAVGFPAYDAMVADLTSQHIRYVPDSTYSESLIRRLRDRLLSRGVTELSLAAGSHEVEYRDTLVVSGGLTATGPRFATFDKRAPTRSEIDAIIADGLGLSLRSVPKADRDLAFLEWLPDLRGLWIYGAVNPARIAHLNDLRQLSLLSIGKDAVDLSALRELSLYEGILAGRESVLSLPLRELYLENTAHGDLHTVPETVEILSLEGATNVTSLSSIVTARGLRELSISGPIELDIGDIGHLLSLRNLTLAAVAEVQNAGVLREVATLRELNVAGSGLDDVDVIGDLRAAGVTVND